MADDFRKAVEAVKLQARNFQAVIDLAAALEGFSSLEQTKREMQAENFRIGQERDKLALERDALVAEIAAKRGQAQDVAREADQSAHKKRAEADEYHRATVARADQTLADAESAARQQVAAANAESSHVAATLAERRAELADLESRITKARERMAKMLEA